MYESDTGLKMNVYLQLCSYWKIDDWCLLSDKDEGEQLSWAGRPEKEGKLAVCLNEGGGSGSTVNELNMRENRGATREESRSHLKTHLLFMEVGKGAAKRHVRAKGSWPTSDETWEDGLQAPASRCGGPIPNLDCSKVEEVGDHGVLRRRYSEANKPGHYLSWISSCWTVKLDQTRTLYLLCFV
jgi:hypothetical protein